MPRPNRRTIEVPVSLYEDIAERAKRRGVTIAALAQDLIANGMIVEDRMDEQLDTLDALVAEQEHAVEGMAPNNEQEDSAMDAQAPQGSILFEMAKMAQEQLPLAVRLTQQATPLPGVAQYAQQAMPIPGVVRVMQEQAKLIDKMAPTLRLVEQQARMVQHLMPAMQLAQQQAKLMQQYLEPMQRLQEAAAQVTMPARIAAQIADPMRIANQIGAATHLPHGTAEEPDTDEGANDTAD